MIKKFFTILLATFLTTIFFFPFLVKEALAATLWFSPTSGTYSVGSTIKLDVGVNTQGEAINAVQANFSYPTDKLQFLSISTGGSALTIFAEKYASGGIVRIAGGIPSPGINGSKYIASVYFKVLKEGSALFSFVGESAVLRDSDNSNVLSGSSTANFTLSGNQATSSGDSKSDTTGGGKTSQQTSQAPKFTISDIKVTDIKKNKVTIEWKTDKETTSVVIYGLGSDYKFNQTNNEYVKEHKVELSEFLTPGNTYHFKVKGVDKDGNELESGDNTFSLLGYSLKIRVFNQKKSPLEGAVVSISSSPQEGKTDKNGEVVFENVSPGDHGLIIRYKGRTIIDKISVVEDDNLQVFEKEFLTQSIMEQSWFRYGAITLAVLIFVVFALVLLIKSRKKLPPSVSNPATVISKT